MGRSAPSPSASLGPSLNTEPYASVAYQIWPAALSAAARQALTGLTVRVRQHGSALSVTAGANGQQPSSPQLCPDGARVYVVESSLGDDSGNTDYSLGDDGLVVTPAKYGATTQTTESHRAHVGGTAVGR